MKVVILTKGQAPALFPAVESAVIGEVVELESHPGADLCVDLDFEILWSAERVQGEWKDGNVDARLAALGKLSCPIILNAVVPTIAEIGRPFIRMNGWPGFVGRHVHELAFPDGGTADGVARLYARLGRVFRPAPDLPGMITARVLATIINEAWYTWEQGVSSKEEIDTAMKLGTNYPMGPFEWGARIGLEKILSLLEALARDNSRYNPSKSLKNAVEKIKI